MDNKDVVHKLISAVCCHWFGKLCRVVEVEGPRDSLPHFTWNYELDLPI